MISELLDRLDTTHLHAFYGSLLLHALLVFWVWWGPLVHSGTPSYSSPQPAWIQSQVIDAPQLDAAVKQLQSERTAAQRHLAEQIHVMKKHQQLEQKKWMQLKSAHQEALRRQKKETQVLKQLNQHLAQQQRSLLTQDLMHPAAKEAPHTESTLNQHVIERYKTLMTQAIARHWVVPEHVDKHRACVLLIKLSPHGHVLSVGLLVSSGDPLLDRSARLAVSKASPLPVPEDPKLRDQFGVVRLTVRPEDRV